ncbi:MAG: hypothetical protein JOY78_09050 [Pseudonocardia sp.]|nr:hypothetical protein [Pseudonocardia sp.]
MWKKVLAAGGVGAVIIGSGGAALAASGSPTSPSPSASTPSATSRTSTGKSSDNTATGKRRHDRNPLLRAEHAQWVTHNKKANTSVTHDEIRGTVTAVSPASISVTAADGTTQNYTVASATKIHAKGDTKTTPGTIGQIKVGDRATVIGTGSTSRTATHILDHGAAKTPTPSTTPSS